MVLISEITEEAAKKEGEPKERDGEPEEEKTEERPRDERKETEQIPPQPAEVDPAELAVPPAEDPKGEAPPQAGKMLYNEYALRVAYIMRSYLYMRQGGAAAAAAEGGGAGGCEGGEERCRAMLEVVRKESGRWAVSRVVLEHTHPLEPPPDLAGALTGGGLVPRVDMEFDSISAAKAYYSTYSEKMGFKAQTGSGKRSRGSRILIMQRFLCSKGSYPRYGNASDGATRKRNRGPYKKRAQRDA